MLVVRKDADVIGVAAERVAVLVLPNARLDPRLSARERAKTMGLVPRRFIQSQVREGRARLPTGEKGVECGENLRIEWNQNPMVFKGKQ